MWLAIILTVVAILLLWGVRGALIFRAVVVRLVQHMQPGHWYTYQQVHAFADAKEVYVRAAIVGFVEHELMLYRLKDPENYTNHDIAGRTELAEVLEERFYERHDFAKLEYSLTIQRPRRSRNRVKLLRWILPPLPAPQPA